ncbi:CGGC domain-containing protein [Veillonella criceti]|uniref:Predicted metal-binding protein n=1 Tax=Veillonella criceti TaxID=103891 RepID=A0A380NP52_9FIRM|nr:CGGC domain-containing protein [Veillonella criceti]SUP44621.1 Predicted metal-binding protein [Veillonella criceti]
MKKIAILVNEDTMQRCSCGGCLGAFMGKRDSFARYEGEELELVGFTHSGGDLAKKLATLRKKGVDIVHISTCTKSKNPEYEAIADACAEYFDVVGYTHGSPDGKGTGKMALMLTARQPKEVE